MGMNAKVLSEFFNAPLEDIAEKFHYSEENMTIIRGDEALFYAKYPKTVAHMRKKDTQWRADNRTPFEFAQNLVMNWLLEDFLALKLSTLGYRTNFNAPDRKREVAIGNVSSTPDLKIFIDGVWTPIEVKADYSGTATTRGTMVLKEGNYKTSLKLKSAILYVDVRNRKFVIIPPSMLLGAKFIPKFAPFGGKAVYEIDTKSLTFSPLDVQLNIDATVLRIPTDSVAKKITDRLASCSSSRKTIAIPTNMVKTSLF